MLINRILKIDLKPYYPDPLNYFIMLNNCLFIIYVPIWLVFILNYRASDFAKETIGYLRLI